LAAKLLRRPNEKLLQIIDTPIAQRCLRSPLSFSSYNDYNDSMDRLPTPLEVLTNRQTLAWLLVPVTLLPIGITILFLFGRFFALLGDVISAAALDWTALALCILWCLSLVLLLLCTVFTLLGEKTEASDLEEQSYH